QPSITTYTGNTTISNGVLALVVPNTLASSPIITLAADTAVLDARQMGYISNFLDGGGNAASSLQTSGEIDFGAGQTINGYGTILASNVFADSSTIINAGLSSNIFGNLVIRGVFRADGAVNLKVGHVGFAASDRITSTNMELNGFINVVQSGTNDL